MGGIFFDDLPDRADPQNPADPPGSRPAGTPPGAAALSSAAPGAGAEEAAAVAPPDAEAFTRDVALSLAASYEPICRARGRPACQQRRDVR